MTRLNQIIALEDGVKSEAARGRTLALQSFSLPGRLSGLSRTYRPKDDEGDKLPAESTRVQVKADDLIRDFTARLTRWFDITATKEHANCYARADVVVDGAVILPQAPVTYLLFLAKRLTELGEFITHLPVLDPAKEWHYDENRGCYATSEVLTTRTTKLPRNHVRAQATQHHPAQVDVYMEDLVVGYWSKVEFSGALPAARVTEMLARVQKLQDAVKVAREEANSAEVKDVKAGAAVLDFVFS